MARGGLTLISPKEYNGHGPKMKYRTITRTTKGQSFDISRFATPSMYWEESSGLPISHLIGSSSNVGPSSSF